MARVLGRYRGLPHRQSRQVVSYGDEEGADTLDAGISDQQHNPAAADHYRFVEESLAGRVALQVDQAALANQTLSGHERERSDDAN